MLVNNAKLIKNAIFLFSRTIIVSLISIFTIRELLNLFGEIEFGLFNLIFGLAAIFTFANGALVVATQRYLGFSLGKNDLNGVREVFLSSCIIYILLGLIMCSIMYYFKGMIIGNLLQLNSMNSKSDYLYNICIIYIFVTFMQSPMIAIINIFEKMRIIASIGILDVLLKLISVYLLVMFPGDNVVNYALFLLFISIFIYIIYLYYCFKKFRDLFVISTINKKIITNNLIIIGNFSGWTLLGNFSWMLRIQGVNAILNMFFGLVANSAYAIFNIVFNSINNLFSSITNAVKPQILISYSKEDHDRFNMLINYASKLFSLGIIVVIFPIIILCNEILLMWLKNIPMYSVNFVRLGLLLLLVESLSTFITIGIQAVGKIKIYQITLSIILISSMPVIYICFKYNYPINSFMYILMLNGFLCFFVRLYFLDKYSTFKLNFFLKHVFLRILMSAVIISSFDYFFLNLFNMTNMSFFYIILLILLTIFFNLCVVYLFGINTSEKNNLKQILNTKFRLIGDKK